MNVLRLLLWGMLLVSSCCIRSAAESNPPRSEITVPIDHKCWVFLHFPKSGGTTVKGILRRNFPRRYTQYAEQAWKRGGKSSKLIAERLANGEDLDVAAGAYTEALRDLSALGNRCQWFTVFRHPITRLVSAYYYCKKNPKDPLCATVIVSAHNIDLLTFAKHWGNFALRQFAHRQVPADSVMEYARTNAVKDKLPPTVQSVESVPGWYQLKMYLEDHAIASKDLNIPDVALYEMLRPVQDLLRDRYTVGILEEFNTTLSLFDAALSMPGVDWHEEYENQGTLNPDNRYVEDTEASLVEAWTSSEIKQYLLLDLALYEHAVDVFHQQKRAYGIE